MTCEQCRDQAPTWAVAFAWLSSSTALLSGVVLTAEHRLVAVGVCSRKCARELVQRNGLRSVRFELWAGGGEASEQARPRLGSDRAPSAQTDHGGKRAARVG